MTSFLLFNIFFLISIIGYGFFFKEKILQLNSSNFGEIGIFGLFLITFLVTIFHFFIPINKNFNLILHLVGAAFFFVNYKPISYFLIKEKKVIFILYFFSLILFFKHKPNEDFGFYHLPYVVNFTSEKLILGLANLQIQQGWNSIWLNLHSAFYFYIINYKGIYFLNCFLFIFICSIFLKHISSEISTINKKRNIVFCFAFFFLSFFLIKFSKLNSYGLDVPANILLILSIFYFLQLIFCEKKNDDLFKLLCVILIFSFSIRISSALFLVLLFYIFVKKKFYKNLIFTKFFLFSIFFLILWITQQFLYTGCLVFPYEFLCFDELMWADKDFILKFKEGTFLANKSYESYSGNLSYNDYFKNFNWVPTWFLRNKIEFFEYIGLFFLIVIISFVMSKKNLLIKINEEKSSYLRILLVTIFLSFLVWFLNSPSIRMGNHLFLSLLFFLIFFPPFFKKNLFIILSKKAIILILILSFSVFLIKHFSRISKNIDYNLEPWPEFKKINYYEETKSGLKINRVINGNSPQLTVCWDVKFLCARSHLDNLKINKKYDYIILSIDK